MERSEATFQAYDGVRLTLADDHVVQVPAFSTREAVHYLRLLSRVEAGDAAAHHAFFHEFPARAGLLGTPLSAFGFAFSDAEIAGGEVTVAEATALVQLLGAAQDGGSSEIVRFLDRFPVAFGIGDDVPPAEIFVAGNAFADEFYRLIYGLAESFLSRLVSTPRVQAKREGTASASMPDSTT